MGEQRILVIDDEEVVLASLRKVFLRIGCSTDTALTAREGIDLLDKGEYDLVVTDLMMPEMNGIELLRNLQSRGNTVPVIMITGYPTISTAVNALRLGARDYISKPFTRKELLSPVMRALRQDSGDGPSTFDGGGSVPDAGSLEPGTVFLVPHHSWARFEQDGVFQVGVDDSFLSAVGRLSSVFLPHVGDILSQGSVGIRLTNEGGEEHGVVMPLSGQVMAVNDEAFGEQEGIMAETWLVRVLPSHLESEIKNLLVRSS